MSGEDQANNVIIATSIMPTRVAEQQEAISSWLKLGFAVVSVNVPGEVEHLHATFPGVRFVKVMRPETKRRERPNVALKELFPVLAAAPGRICGIVNSDICFCVRDDFLAFIEENAAQGMVFGSRIDVDNDNHDVGKEYCLGFDYFFFDKELIPLYPATDFCLGLPYWDYWVPLVLLSKGVTVKRLISPVAIHLRHYSYWEQHLEVFGNKFLGSLYTLFLSDRQDQVIPSRLLDSIKAGDMGASADVAHFILRYLVQSLSYLHPKITEACVTINKAAFVDMKEKLVSYEERLADKERALASVLASRSWQLTEPLRILKSQVKTFIK